MRGVMLSLLLLAVGLVQSQSFNDYFIDDLYKRLAELDYLESYPSQYASDGSIPNNIVMDPRLLEEEQEAEEAKPALRDHEMMEHSNMAQGFQYISGGAGEGKQHLKPDGAEDNVHEVKSDESLPFYCHPPNPCPLGYTSKDGCDEGVKDDADFQQRYINELMERSACECDGEHMFRCPKNRNMVDAEMPTEEDVMAQQEFKNAIDNFMQKNNPYLSDGHKMRNVVAKKSPVLPDGGSFDTPM